MNFLRAEDLKQVGARPSIEQDNKVGIKGDEKVGIRRDDIAGTEGDKKVSTKGQDHNGGGDPR